MILAHNKDDPRRVRRSSWPRLNILGPGGRACSQRVSLSSARRSRFCPSFRLKVPDAILISATSKRPRWSRRPQPLGKTRRLRLRRKMDRVKSDLPAPPRRSAEIMSPDLDRHYSGGRPTRPRPRPRTTILHCVQHPNGDEVTLAAVFGPDMFLVLLFAILGWAIPIWAIIDAAGKPAVAFYGARSNKTAWILVLLVTMLLGLGFFFGAYYLIGVSPKVRRQVQLSG